MADPEQLAILGKGVVGWNERRKKHLYAEIDLYNADLGRAFCLLPVAIGAIRGLHMANSERV